MKKVAFIKLLRYKLANLAKSVDDLEKEAAGTQDLKKQFDDAKKKIKDVQTLVHQVKTMEKEVDNFEKEMKSTTRI